MLKPLTLAFVLIAGGTCFPLAAITPLGQVADEPAHMLRAAGLSGGHVMGYRAQITGPAGTQVTVSGVMADPAALIVASKLPASGGPPQALTLGDVIEERNVGWFPRPMFMATGPNATYFPALYVPSALGFGIARLSGLLPFDALLAGRAVNVLAFVLLGTLVLQIARRGQAVMFCALACPLTLSLAASFNEDGLLIAASLLAAALMSRAGSRDRIAAAALVACVAMAKPPYLVLGVLLLVPLPLLGAWRALRRAMLGRLLLLASLSMLVVGWAGWMLVQVATPIPRVPYAAGPLWPGAAGTMFDGTDPAAQLSVLLAQPARLLTLPVDAFAHDPWLAYQMVGFLGWLNVGLPDLLYLGWFMAFGLALAADLVRPRDRQAAATETVLLSAAIVVGAWAIYLIQYLTWSDVGLDHIAGMQGRYLLPLAALLALALPRIPIFWADRLAATLTVAPVAAALAGAFVLPRLIAAAYYLR